MRAVTSAISIKWFRPQMSAKEKLDAADKVWQQMSKLVGGKNFFKGSKENKGNEFKKYILSEVAPTLFDS